MKPMERRIKKELEELEKNPICNAEIFPEEDGIFNKLILSLPGPEGSKYENEIFEILMEFPNDYPFKPPRLEFQTPIDCPSLEKNGRIYLYSLIGMDWRPDIYIKDLIERLHFYLSPAETRIDTFTKNKVRYTFDKTPVNSLIKGALGHSLNENQELAFIGSNVPVLYGFYTAHANHCPIKIKPDDIWLLIIQGFINHVNENSENLRSLFVNFSGKKNLEISYPLDDISKVDKKTLEDFSCRIVNKIEEYIGKDLIDILSPNFTTTTPDSEIICKISIMGAFKKYFDYTMMIFGCGVPYVVLDGTADDYKKIMEKAKKLKIYKFSWYIDRIIPHIEKMIEAKEGKLDKEYFKNMIQKAELVEIKKGASGYKLGEYKVDALSGWFLDFFSYIESEDGKRIYQFNEGSIKIKDFPRLTNQMIEVPFKIINTLNKKEYDMKFKVGFVGCDKNENNEVFPVQGWLASQGK